MDLVADHDALSGDAGRRAGQPDPRAVRVSRHRAGRHPAVHLHGQDADRRLDHADGHRPAAHPRPGAARTATCSTSSPGRCPARASPTSVRTSAFRCRSRRSASTWTPTRTSSRSASASTGWQKRLEIITILDPVTGQIPMPVPMPNINIFKPPLGLRPTPPAKIVFDGDSAALTFDEAAQAGDRARHSIVGADHRQRLARRAALRAGPARAHAGRRARRRRRPTTACTTWTASRTTSSAASTSRTSRCRATA